MAAITMTIVVAIVIVAMVRYMLLLRVIVALVTYILLLSNCFYGDISAVAILNYVDYLIPRKF